MDIAETNEQITEIYNSNNIQNQSIDDFWANDTHYVKKTTIKGNEYYECIFDMYFNSDVSKNLKSKKLIEDNAKYIYDDLINKIDDLVNGSSGVIFRSVEYVKIQ